MPGSAGFPLSPINHVPHDGTVSAICFRFNAQSLGVPDYFGLGVPTILHAAPLGP
jgi:hypothetical protein